MSPPLRFLAVVVGGWICFRTVILALDSPRPGMSTGRTGISATHVSAAPAFARERTRTAPVQPLRAQQARSARTPLPLVQLVTLTAASAARPGTPAAPIADLSMPSRAPLLVPSLSAAPASARGRWSASAWLLLREGGGGALARAATLGGSQWGGRLSYRLNADAVRPLAATARLYSPLDGDGAEASLDLEWQPLGSLPVRVLAERRIALEKGGRNAFSLLAYGGVSGRRVLGPVLMDAYGQTGIVGLHSRDAFVDGAATLSMPVKDGIQAGVGVWGAAQPGIARLDAGPQLSVVLPVTRLNARLSGVWRVRLAGKASPGSGPALTLGADFGPTPDVCRLPQPPFRV